MEVILEQGINGVVYDYDYDDLVNSTTNNCSKGEVTTSNVDGHRLIAVAVINIFIVILPSSVLGLTAISLLPKTRNSRSPVDEVFFVIAILCITGALMLGLLDLSVITNVPFLGRCNTLEATIYLGLFHIFFTSLTWMTAILSITIFSNVSSGSRGCCNVKVLRIVMATFLALNSTFPVVLLGYLTHLWTARIGTIRGSFCSSVYNDPTAFLRFSIAYFFVASVVPVILTFIFVLLSWYKIKKSVIKMDRGIAQSVITFITVVFVVVSVTRLPSILISFAGRRLRAGSSFLFSYIITSYYRLNFLTYVMLILLLHKQVREKLVKAMKKLIRKRNPSKVTVVPVNRVTST